MWNHQRRLAFRAFSSSPIQLQLLAMILFLMIPLASLITYSIVNKRNEAIRAAFLSTAELADNIAHEKQQLVAGAQQLASTLSQLPEVQHKKASVLQPLLARLLRMNSQYVNISVTDRNGITWASALPFSGTLSVADRRYLKNALATGRFSAGEYAIGKVSGKPILGFGQPLFDKKGHLNGVIVISLDLNHLRHLPIQSKYPKGTSIVLMDHKGTILVRSIGNDSFMGKQFKPGIFNRIESLQDGSSFRAEGIDNVERYSSHRKLWLEGEPVPYLYIRAGIPVDAVLKKTYPGLLANAGMSISLLAAAFVFAWIIAKRSIVDRVQTLELACKGVANGDLNVRVADMVVGGELGRLGTMFDSMAQRLEEREQELLASRNMLQELNHRLETAQEQERNHLAREIHDMMGQSLTALKLDLAWLEQQTPRPSPDTVERHEEMLALVDSLIGMVQAITAKLTPPLLELGLAEAIEWHAKENERRSGISCLMLLDETSSHLLCKKHETMLFRVFQEALTNVVRHAGASEVSISLCVTSSAVVLEVADNGKGITREAIDSPTSFGLLGMRQRAAMCGAGFFIRGEPGNGTIVKVEVGRSQT